MRQLFTCFIVLICFINYPKAQIVFERHIIDNTKIRSAVSTLITDINGDAQMDVIGLSHNGHLNWYTSNGLSNITSKSISATFTGAQEESIFAVDMDNDGDMDIIGAETAGDKIVWLENDGQGNFTRYIIDQSIDAPWSIHAADMDLDGDMDIVAAANYSSEIILYENNGFQSFSKHVITQNFKYATSVLFADMDGDLDVDILGGAAGGLSGLKGVVWWENNNFQFSTAHIIAMDLNIENVQAADVDGDGDTDILATSLYDDNILLWKNDGNQNFTKEIIDENYRGADSVFPVDMDDDQDMDFVAVGYFQDSLHYWENDGLGNFTKQLVGIDYQGASEVYAADIDGDGDIDISTSNTVQKDISIWLNQSSPVATNNILVNSQFSLFPNPTSGYIYMDTKNQTLYSVHIMTMDGKVVLAKNTSDLVLDVSFLAPGMYEVIMETKTSVQTKKLIVP